MRFSLCVTALVGLTACAPSIPESGAGSPDSGRGVGFGTSDEYIAQQRARDAQLQSTSAVPRPGAISPEARNQANPGAPLSATEGATAPRTPGTVTSSTNTTRQTASGAYTPTGGLDSASTSDEIARETAARLAETSQNSGQLIVHASPSNPAPQTVTSAGGISNENNFDAVGNARSIQDDAELIAQNRAQYQVVQPGALPERSGNSGPNIVQYALETSHPKGQQLYTRVGINKQAKFQRNCAKYNSADQAQTDFLAQGGPRRDRMGLDPDGDGYACAWDPRPFRAAVQN
ncbi:hypothetical protein FIU86_06345 [Roseovarius sp. THAF9]|uniref:hypothetical protein n=1 Tax=Roseovarius sp. THAF9 TaxID=2587847 RepID=UPI0012686ADA|nr:hypothetical protein [Roseovarius sp. THAF9]QFT92454.1 hypothetical protein FIU86_06345 [Roseovarius sp. THAF9]